MGLKRHYFIFNLLGKVVLVLICVLDAGNTFSAVMPFNLVPEKNATVIGGEITRWKELWDTARHHARIGEYVEAIKTYEALLSENENIQEARWELARIHMHLSHWEESSAILELLVESEPDRGAYLTGLGRVMWEMERYDRAVDLFKRAYVQNEDDETALAGLVEGFIKLGKRKEALPFLEQLHNLQPDNVGIHRYLGMLAFDMEQYDKARVLLAELAAMKNPDQEVLLRAALVHDKLNLPNISRNYWHQILASEPGNISAHTRLAEIYENNGEPREALPHLRFLLNQSPSESTLLKRTGKAYDDTGQPENALQYYLQYLAMEPDDPEVLRAVSKIQALLGNKEETLATLEKYFQVVPESPADDLKLAAELYDGTGRFHKAIPLYRKLIENSPEDPELLAALANDLLAIGENEGALSMWKHLARIVKEPLTIFRPMADLLSNLGRTREEIEILERIHKLDPADLQTMMRLADLYLDQGELPKAIFYFEQLASLHYQEGDYLASRGKMYVMMRQPERALQDYNTFLQKNPGRIDIRLRIAELAASLGLFTSAIDQFEYINAIGQTKTSTVDSFQLLFVKANAFLEAGFYHTAIEEYYRTTDQYRKDPAENAGEVLSQALLGIAQSYQSAGLYYEKEQVLRQALSNDEQKSLFLLVLFQNSLQREQWDEAEIWLHALLQQHNDSGSDIVGLITDWQLRMFEATLLAKQGEYRAAYKKSRRLFSEFSSNSNSGNQSGKNRQPRLATGLSMCRIHLEAGKLRRAERLGTMLLAEGWVDLELFVLLQQVYLADSNHEAARDIYNKMVKVFWDGDEKNADAGEIFHLISLYADFGDTEMKLKFSRAVQKKMPDSIKAKILVAESLAEKESLAEAQNHFSLITEKYPGNVRALTGLARIFFNLGQYDEAIAVCDKVLQQHRRPDVLLLKARAAWAKHKWKESFAIYGSYVEPSVNMILADELVNQGIVLTLEPLTTWWNVITFSEGKSPEVAEVVMSPSFVLDSSEENREVTEIAFPFYAQFRWQQQFTAELAARRSMQRRQYNQAISQFEVLLENEKSDSLLFDLAGLYGSLDRLEEEAVLYERLTTANPQYPGLQDAIENNRLQRRPELSLSYGFLKEEGWDNYKSIMKKWGEVSTVFSPKTRHKVGLSHSRIKYQDSTDAENILWSNRVMASYQITLTPGLLSSFTFGIEDLDDGHPNTEVFSLDIRGKIGDTLKSHFKYTRDVTADTIASLKRNISNDLYEAGISADFFPRLTLGADFGQKLFSDGNHTDQYLVWSSYVFFFDPTYLSFTYSHDVKESEYGPTPGPPLADGFGANDYPYYSPTSYWLSKFSIFFKHQLLSYSLGRGFPRHYTLEYSWGYDKFDDNLQSIKTDFFWELSQHFDVKVSTEVSDLKSYVKNEVFLSAVYKW